VELTKPQLVLSMRAVKLFCHGCPFHLSDVVKTIQPHDFFMTFDDVHSFKQISLSPELFEFFGF
jgi:anthranilate/para-aminobenzoate synthase component I